MGCTRHYKEQESDQRQNEQCSVYAWGYSLGLMDVDGSVPLTPLSQEVALAIAFF